MREIEVQQTLTPNNYLFPLLAVDSNVINTKYIYL